MADDVPHGLKYALDMFGEEKFVELGHAFVRSVPAAIVNLRDHVSAGAWSDAQRIAHSLKGTFVVLGLIDCSATAMTLDALLKRLAISEFDASELVDELTTTLTVKLAKITAFFSSREIAL